MVSFVPCWCCAGVSKPLCNGADLMLPGILDAEAAFVHRIGTKCKVMVRGNPMPIGVGEMRVDARHIADVGTEAGIGVTMHHVYGDALWAMAPGTPNEGFQQGFVLRIPAEEDSEEEGNDEQEDEQEEEQEVAAAEEEEEQEEAVANGEASQPVAGDGSAETVALAEEVDRGLSMEPGAAVGDDAAEESVEGLGEEGLEEGEEGAPLDIGAMSQDELLEFSFTMALKKSVKDNKLPMLVNEFYSNHLLLCRPAGSTLDLKKSSYKKIGKFLQAHTQ